MSNQPHRGHAWRRGGKWFLCWLLLLGSVGFLVVVVQPFAGAAGALPTPTATLPGTRTPPPTSQPTAPPDLQPTAQPTSQPTPTATPAPPPTATPAAQPTATPTNACADVGCMAVLSPVGSGDGASPGSLLQPALENSAALRKEQS